MDSETASDGPLENGVQRNASRFETEKNVNTPLVTSDPFLLHFRPLLSQAFIPANLLAGAINFVAVGSNPVRRKINQLPNLQMNSALTFHAPFQLGERCADGRES
jgi:hypothetical protein